MNYNIEKMEGSEKEEERREAGEERILIATDVRQLFPNMKKEHTGRVVKESWIKSGMKIEGLRWEDMAKYIAICCNPGEIRLEGLSRIVPRRVHRKGPKPSINGKGARLEGQEELQWEFDDVEPTDNEISRLVGKVLEIGVRTIWENNLYTFGRKGHERG